MRRRLGFIPAANPSRELVQEYHAKFVAALQALFDEQKHCVGWEHKTLLIV